MLIIVAFVFQALHSMAKLFSYPKSAKLKSRKAIAHLFNQGAYIYKYPIKLYFISNKEGFNKLTASAPKRNHKSAVNRNLLKRRMREAYRLNQSIISHTNYDILFLYTAKEIENYQKIETSMIYLLNELALRNSIAST